MRAYTTSLDAAPKDGRVNADTVIGTTASHTKEGDKMNQPSESPSRREDDILPSIKMYQDIVDRAHSEVNSVREVYKWLCVGLGIIISTGIGCAVYLTYNNIREMRADMKADRADMRANMKDEIELVKTKAKQDYLLLATDLKSSVENKTQDVQRTVNSRIDAEFNNDKIKTLVTNKAQDRIDAIADPYISKQVEQKITPKISAFNKTLKEIENNVNFNAAFSAAQNDDRSAFEQLRKWANDKTYPLRTKAQESVDGIIYIKSSVFQYLTWENSYPWKPGTDPSKLNLADLRKQFGSEALPGMRTSLIDYLDTRNDINKKDKLKFLQEILLTDKSLDVSIRSIQLCNKITGQNFDPFDAKVVLDWYSKPRNIE